MPSRRLPREDQRRVRGEHAAVPGDERDVVLSDLPAAAVPAELDDGLGDGRHPPHVEARELTPAGVDGQPAAGAGHVLRGERPTLALRAEAVVLERHEYGEGVAVIQLDEVDV